MNSAEQVRPDCCGGLSRGLAGGAGAEPPIAEIGQGEWRQRVRDDAEHRHLLLAGIEDDECADDEIGKAQGRRQPDPVKADDAARQRDGSWEDRPSRAR